MTISSRWTALARHADLPAEPTVAALAALAAVADRLAPPHATAVTA